MNYGELVRLENLFSAWYEFKKGKSNKRDVMCFERNLEDNIFALHEDLNTKTYKHQGYSTFHVYDPKFRVINKASVRDRVVHHLVYKFLEPLYLPAFIHSSYACQPGKGIHLAVNDLSRALRRASANYTAPLWSLKLDIRKFFDSIDHKILLALLSKKITDRDILWLMEEVVGSFCSARGSGKGVPIGNLTSQIFSNIYLSELDYFVKNNLRERHYFRYADDFLFLNRDWARLKEIQNAVGEFLESRLRLTLHPQKISLRKFNQGVDFVGYVQMPYYRLLRTSTKRRMFAKLKQKARAYNERRLDDENVEQSFQSYLGLLSHCNGYEVEKRLRNELWMELEKNNFV